MWNKIRFFGKISKRYANLSLYTREDFQVWFENHLADSLEETSNRKWDGWPSGSGHYYFQTGSIQVKCQNSDEAHALINCLWKDLYLGGLAEMEVLEFYQAVVCKFTLKPEVLFNSWNLFLGWFFITSFLFSPQCMVNWETNAIDTFFYSNNKKVLEGIE